MSSGIQQDLVDLSFARESQSIFPAIPPYHLSVSPPAVPPNHLSISPPLPSLQEEISIPSDPPIDALIVEEPFEPEPIRYRKLFSGEATPDSNFSLTGLPTTADDTLPEPPSLTRPSPEISIAGAAARQTQLTLAQRLFSPSPPRNVISDSPAYSPNPLPFDRSPSPNPYSDPRRCRPRYRRRHH